MEDFESVRKQPNWALEVSSKVLKLNADFLKKLPKFYIVQQNQTIHWLFCQKNVLNHVFWDKILGHGTFFFISKSIIQNSPKRFLFPKYPQSVFQHCYQQYQHFPGLVDSKTNIVLNFFQYFKAQCIFLDEQTEFL